MTNALADSDVCKDSTAAGVLAKEGEREREIGREGRRKKTIQSHLRLMNDAYEICCGAYHARTHARTVHTYTWWASMFDVRKIIVCFDQPLPSPHSRTDLYSKIPATTLTSSAFP